MVFLPEKQRVDQFAQQRPALAVMPLSPRYRRDGFVRPAVEKGIDQLIDGYRDLLTPSAHRLLLRCHKQNEGAVRQKLQACQRHLMPPYRLSLL